MADAAVSAQRRRIRAERRRRDLNLDVRQLVDRGRGSVRRLSSSSVRGARWAEQNEAAAVRLGLVLVVAGFGLALVLFRSFVLPAKFLYDGDTIHRLALSGAPGWDVDESFANVAAVYRILGLQDNDVLAALIGYGLALAAIGFAIWRRRFLLNVPGTVAVVLSVLFSAVYLGTYSKDVFVLPIAVLAMQARGGWRRELVLVGTLLVYADVFRTYWFLVAGFYILYRIVDRLSRTRWPLFAAPVLALVLLAFLFPLVLGIDSDFARAQSNQWRAGSPDATTMINHFVQLGGPTGSALNTVLVLLTVFVPVPLILRGGAYYLAISMCFVALWATFFLGLSRIRRQTDWMRPVVLVLAFVTTQALFEPDYGSLLRHLTPLMSLLCLAALAPLGRRRSSVPEAEAESVESPGVLEA